LESVATVALNHTKVLQVKIVLLIT
jgi:hypothetical protein